MAEFSVKPSGSNSDPDNLNWANTASEPGDYSEPILSKRNTGWVMSEPPPFTFVNWAWRLIMLMIAWLTSWHIRAFPNMEDAVPIVTEGHAFILGKPSGFDAPLSVNWAIVGAGAVTNVVCDGEFVYYAQGQILTRASRLDGSTLTTRDLGASITDVSADGFVVCATTADNGTTELFCVDPC